MRANRRAVRAESNKSKKGIEGAATQCSLALRQRYQVAPAPDLPQVRGPTCSEGLVLKDQDLLHLK